MVYTATTTISSVHCSIAGINKFFLCSNSYAIQIQSENRVVNSLAINKFNVSYQISCCVVFYCGGWFNLHFHCSFSFFCNSIFCLMEEISLSNSIPLIYYNVEINSNVELFGAEIEWRSPCFVLHPFLFAMYLLILTVNCAKSISIENYMNEYTIWTKSFRS